MFFGLFSPPFFHVFCFGNNFFAMCFFQFRILFPCFLLRQYFFAMSFCSFFRIVFQCFLLRQYFFLLCVFPFSSPFSMFSASTIIFLRCVFLAFSSCFDCRVGLKSTVRQISRSPSPEPTNRRFPLHHLLPRAPTPNLIVHVLVGALAHAPPSLEEEWGARTQTHHQHIHQTLNPKP